MFYSLDISNNIDVPTSIQLSHQEDSWRLSWVGGVQYYVKLAYLLLSDKCIPNPSHYVVENEGIRSS